MNWAKTLIILYFIIDAVGVVLLATCRIPIQYSKITAVGTVILTIILVGWVANA